MASNRDGVSAGTRSFFYLLAAFCLCFLIWSAVGRLDIVSEAVGEVIPRTKVKRIQHLEGGIIHEIHVREGDSVIKDQPLVALESTASGSSVEELQVRINALSVEIMRLEAESRGLDAPEFSNELRGTAPELVEQALDLFYARQERLLNETVVQEEKVKQREQDVQEIEARLSNLRSALVRAKEDLHTDRILYSDKLITKKELNSSVDKKENLESGIKEDSASLAKARSLLIAAKEGLERVRNAYLEDVQKDLKKARRELMELSERLKKFSDEMSRTIIRSPVDGVVKNLFVINPGEVVRSGVTIMDIVPADDPLVIEAHLPIQDIGYVAKGQRALVSLASRDAQRFGKLEGLVSNVSPDAVTLSTGETFYRVRVVTENDYFEKNGMVYRLFPGMRVIVGIHIGDRTILEYLLEPFLGTIGHGMQEH